MYKKLSLIALLAVTISLGVISIPAYAGNEEPEPEPVPVPPFDKDFVHVEFDGPFADELDIFIGASFASDDGEPSTSGLELFTATIEGEGFPGPAMECLVEDGGVCTFLLENYVDTFPNKLIHIDITYDTGTAPASPPAVSILCESIVNEELSTLGIPDLSDPPLLDTSNINFDVWLLAFECHPNPDWEIITIDFSTEEPLFIEFWTATFDDPPEGPEVGGTFVPIDNTALILAGAQSISMWMIPVVIAGIGIAIFVVKRRN